MAERFAIVNDLHYAHRPPRKARCYADALDKLRRAVARFNKAGVETLLVLGDLVDQPDDRAAERAYLLRVREALDVFGGDWYLTPGNHDLENFDKAELFALMGCEPPPLAIELGGARLLLIDGCYRADGEPYAHGNFDWTDAQIGGGQVDWLKQQLAQAHDAHRRAVVCCHHPLVCDDERYVVANAGEMRAALNTSPAAVAYVCGHYHKGGALELNGVSHITLKAMSDTEANTMQGVIVAVDGHQLAFR